MELLQANTAALLECITANEKAVQFDLSDWFANDCRTYGCLIGNHCIYTNKDLNQIIDIYKLPDNIFDWLFMPWNFRKNEGLGLNVGIQNGSLRDCKDKEAAIRRLRKLTWYILHKRDILSDPKYGIKESARNSEGNLNVLNSVSAQVRELARV